MSFYSCRFAGPFRCHLCTDHCLKVSVVCSSFGKRVHEIIVTKPKAADGKMLHMHEVYNTICEHPQRCLKLLGDKAYANNQTASHVLASQPVWGDMSNNHEIGKKRYTVECHIGDLVRWRIFRGDSRYMVPYYDDHHVNRMRICMRLQNLMYDYRRQYSLIQEHRDLSKTWP